MVFLGRTVLSDGSILVFDLRNKLEINMCYVICLVVHSYAIFSMIEHSLVVLLIQLTSKECDN